MHIRIFKQKEAWLVLFTSLFTTLITSAKFFSQLIHRPANHVFVGMTHYFEDFYYYLDQFYQGAHGGWLTVNNFTIEALPPTLIYLPHILLGKIGGFLGLAPFTSYNLSVLLLKFIFILLSYKVLMYIFPKNSKYRYFTFLLFLFSSALPFGYLEETGEIAYQPRRIWGTKNLISSRFGNIPYRFVINILFLTILLLLWRLFSHLWESFNVIDNKNNLFTKRQIIKLTRYLLPISLLLILLTLSDSALSLILIVSTVIMVLLNRPKANRKRYIYTSFILLLGMLVPFLIAVFYMAKIINIDTIYSQAIAWDLEQYSKQFFLLGLSDYILSFGPLGLAMVIGLISFIRKRKNAFEQWGGIILGLCVVGYLLPAVLSLQFPGNRFIFAATYLFAAIVALYGLLTIDKFFENKLLNILIIGYLLININTFRLSLMKNIKIPEEPDYHFTYIPNDIYKGLLFLEKLGPKNAIVLGNPDTSMDLMIPGLTGKKTYSGHFLITLNAAEKDRLAHAFFYDKQKEEDVRSFLEKNTIKYIMKTAYSTHALKLTSEYPFLTTLFENDMVAIYTY